MAIWTLMGAVAVTDWPQRIYLDTGTDREPIHDVRRLERKLEKAGLEKLRLRGENPKNPGSQAFCQSCQTWLIWGMARIIASATCSSAGFLCSPGLPEHGFLFALAGSLPEEVEKRNARVVSLQLSNDDTPAWNRWNYAARLSHPR